MARVPMVTRTIKTTKVNVLCLDLVKCEPLNKELVLTGRFKNNEQLMKAVSKEIDVENVIKAVQITSTKELETLYGMEELDFIKNAKELPPRE